MAEQHNKPAQAKVDDNFKYIVRIANTDLDGKKSILFAMEKIKGVGYCFASAVLRIAGIDPMSKVGYLSDADIAKIDEIVSSPLKYKVPIWMANRRNDPATGEDMHLLGGDLQFAKESDIRFMKKIKCYKGIRHMHGLPVRGQKTRSNFRDKSKGKKATLGVQRKKVGAPAPKDKEK